MKCNECSSPKFKIVKNASGTQALPFTVICSKCKKWYDVSKTKVAIVLNVPYNMVGLLV